METSWSYPMKNLYLATAIIGAVIPLFFFMQFFGADGEHQLDFFTALFVNGATSGFAADLLISSFVFWAFMFTRDEFGPKPWPFIALNLCIGLSCALPAYLYSVERHK